MRTESERESGHDRHRSNATSPDRPNRSAEGTTTAARKNDLLPLMVLFGAVYGWVLLRLWPSIVAVIVVLVDLETRLELDLSRARRSDQPRPDGTARLSPPRWVRRRTRL